MKKRILSGIQPSGELHLGNYFGMMSRMIEYQEKNDLFCCIVNLHALTTIDDKSILSENTVITTGIGIFFSRDSVEALKALQNSIMLTPR